MKKVIKYEESSGNVLADLSIENPEEALAKAELARQIAKLIKKKKLNQKQAAEILGIDQPKISALIRGRLRSFSLERLIRFLNELGQDVSIMISPAKSALRGHTRISESHSNTPLAALGK
ncbi:helix-turn-helix transcriptional regulator [Neochlamydia sp. AcF95]|uniref:helix-turn-helix domain-containing protein n=1 Tax=Neochlamydia sp. AcF95 TaxID=2795734 RepID=UPI001BC93682|nr:helix-turn-helix transcriptional regulator [Neochlamydia sp. AcF95]